MSREVYQAALIAAKQEFPEALRLAQQALEHLRALRFVIHGTSLLLGEPVEEPYCWPVPPARHERRPRPQGGRP